MTDQPFDPYKTFKEAGVTASPESHEVSTETETVEVDTLLVLISLLEGFVLLFKESRDKERCRLLAESLKLHARILQINGVPPQLSNDYIREKFKKQEVIDIADTLLNRYKNLFLPDSDNYKILAGTRNYLEKFAQSLPDRTASPSNSNDITSKIDSINLKLEKTWDTTSPTSDKNHPLEYVTLWDRLFGGVGDVDMARHVGLWIAAYIAPLPRGWQNSRYCLGEIMRLYYMYQESKNDGMSDEWYGEVYMAIERMQLWAKVGLRKGSPRVRWPYFGESMSREDFEDKLYQLELADYPDEIMQPDRDSGTHS